MGVHYTKCIEPYQTLTDEIFNISFTTLPFVSLPIAPKNNKLRSPNALSMRQEFNELPPSVNLNDLYL